MAPQLEHGADEDTCRLADWHLPMSAARSPAGWLPCSFSCRGGQCSCWNMWRYASPPRASAMTGNSSAAACTTSTSCLSCSQQRGGLLRKVNDLECQQHSLTPDRSQPARHHASPASVGLPVSTFTRCSHTTKLRPPRVHRPERAGSIACRTPEAGMVQQPEHPVQDSYNRQPVATSAPLVGGSECL